ncbi:IMP cyclohydrolase [Halohasta salina]|uniref:IMP cyclohydrolase n=1 Tax=Halohasta salina TaxID=2961621 RepID=UPI0020A5BC69|nr:IMP cyclohydrolase [Halohasta salina]
MYIGRFIVVGPGLGAYRVSSRSFPNRQITDREGTLTVGPTEDAPETDNPYVSYNCVRTVDGPATEGEVAVVGNGSHVDPVAEKLELGYPPRDALAASLLTLDYEKDDYNTPRIAGVVAAEEAYIGTVRHDTLLVKAVDEPTLVATYEENSPTAYDLDAATAADAAAELYEAAYEHAVCAAGVEVDDGATYAIENGE